MCGIDTVRFMFRDFLLDDCPKDWEYRPVITSGSLVGETFEYMSEIKNGVIVRYIYYPNRNTSTPPSLFVTCSSIPRILFGNNYTSIQKFSSVWDCVQKELQQDSHSIIPCDIKNAELSRLDVFQHYDVGVNNLELYWDVISRAFYPHRERGPYRNSNNEYPKLEVNNGYTFGCESIKTSFYDKYIQSGDFRVKGHIRHEIQFSSAKVIRSKFHLDDPRCIDISSEFIQNYHKKDLDVLMINHPIVDQYSAERILKDKYGNRDGTRLSDLCVYLMNHPLQGIRDVMGSRGIKDRDHFIKQLKKISNCGITPYTLPIECRLPRLSDCAISINEKKTGCA